MGRNVTARVSGEGIFFVASMLLSIAILVAYIVCFSQPEFNSDCATNSLQAQAMYEQGTLYPPSWKVANGDMIFPSAAVLIAPMLSWLPNGFLVNAIAATTLSLALLASLGYFLRIADISWPATALIVMTLALGFSRAFILMTYLETANVWWPLAFFVLAGLVVSDDLRARAGNARTVVLPLLIFIASLVISLKNPSRVAIMVLLPALVFSRALAVFGKEQSSIASSSESSVSRHALTRELAMLLGLAIAFVTIKLLIYTGRIDNSAGLLPYLHVTDAKGFWNHLKLFCSGWFEYLGAYVEGHAYQKYEPVMRVFRTAIVAALTLNLFLELWQWKKNIDPIRRALLAAFLAVFLPTVAMYLIFDPLAQNHLSTRYFTVPYLILLALAGWRINDMLHAPRTSMRWILVIFCIISITSGIQRMIPLGESLPQQSRYQLLAAVLQQEGLKYGYGSWWNASSTTILSDSKVRVLPVQLSPSEIKPYLNWVDTNQFYQKHETGSSFLIIAEDELLQDQRDLIQEMLGPAQREIAAGDARILVYDHDIANSFVCKGTAMNTPLPGAEFEHLKILAVDILPRALTDGRRRIKVKIRNESPLDIGTGGSYPITVGIHLLDKNGVMIDNDFLHASLGCPFAPGDERAVLLTLPNIPQGGYQLEVDLVQEGYAWFAEKGGETKRVEISTHP